MPPILFSLIRHFRFRQQLPPLMLPMLCRHAAVSFEIFVAADFSLLRVFRHFAFLSSLLSLRHEFVFRFSSMPPDDFLFSPDATLLS